MKTRTTLSVTHLRLPRAVFAAIAALAPLHGFAAGEDKLSDLALEDLLRVTVSSVTRFEQPTTEAPASVTVIDNDELRQHGYRNLAEALATVPGVYTSGDRNYTFLGVRGFNRPGDYGTRILLLTDGARRNDPLYDQALLGNESPVEIDWVKRLEFVSGPASAIYGANALFGTANAVMLEGGDIDGTRITLDGGTSATRRLNVMAGQRLEGDRDWFVGFAAYKSHGEDLYFKDFDNGTTNGHANGLDGESYQKAYAKYRWGHWRLTGNYSWRDKNDPAASYGTTFGEHGTNTVDESRLIELRYESDANDDWQPSFRVYNGHYRFTGNYNYSPAVNTRDFAEAEWSGTEFRLAYAGFAQHKLSAGIEAQWNHRLLQRYFELSPYNSLLETNNPSRTAAFYLQDEWRFHPEWLLNIGVRHDKHNQFSGVTSPRLALIWQATQRLTLKAVSGSAYRVPNAYERFYTDAGASQSANPALQPEYIRTREFSAAYRFGQTGRLGMSFYRNEISDLIDPTETLAGTTMYINQRQVTARGIEIDAENRWENGLRLRGSIAWQRSRMEDGTQLVDSPQRMGKLIASMPVWAGWTASGELLALSHRLGSNGPVSGYGIINASLMSRPDKRYGQFGLSFYNIGDRHYFDPAASSMTQSSILQAGRQVRLRWTLAF